MGYFDKFNSKSSCNPELFYDAQMLQDALTWRLKAGGALILKGILQDSEITYGAQHEYGSPNGGLLRDITGQLNKYANKARGFYMAKDTYKHQKRRYLKSKDNSPMGKINRGIAQTAQNVEDWLGDRANELSSALDKWGYKDEKQKVMDFAQDINSVLDRAAYGHFINSFDFIKVFNGTTSTIELPSLSTIILNDDSDSLKSTLLELNTEFIGPLQDGAGIFGLQNNPGYDGKTGEYKPRFDSLEPDVVFPGTLTLELGQKYKITNLICTTYNVKVSTLYRKDGGANNTPLYAEVSVGLDFGAYVDRTKINNCLVNMM